MYKHFTVLLLCNIIKSEVALHGGAVVSTVASQQEGCGFDTLGQAPFCVDLACFCLICLGIGVNVFFCLSVWPCDALVTCP